MTEATSLIERLEAHNAHRRQQVDVEEKTERETIDQWLTANCGKGLPHEDAHDLPTALHGLAYLLRQIESASTYKVFIGQVGPATSSLRWVLDYLAADAIQRGEHRRDEHG